MAKSDTKTEDAVQSKDAEVTAPTEAKTSKAFKFKVLGGKYHTSTRKYIVGDVVETDEDLIAQFGRFQFELIK